MPKPVASPRINPGCPRVLLSNSWFLLALIVALAATLRLYELGTENLWNDEWLSLDNADHIANLNQHRPLFYLVLHYWTRILWIVHLQGQDGWLRLPAVAFGIAEVPLLYLLGRRLFGERSSLIACLLMAIAVPEIDHSQEVRMYTMASALTLAATWALIEWYQNSRWSTLVSCVLLTYLAYLTTPAVIASLLLAQCLVAIALVRRANWTALVSLLASCSLVLAAWWPLKRHIAEGLKGLEWVPRPPPIAPLRVHSDFLTGGLGAVRNFHPMVGLQIAVSVVIVSLVVIAVFAPGSERTRPRVIALWFYAVVIGMYILSVVWRPLWSLRFVHHTAPALYLLMAFGVVTLWRRYNPGAVIVCAVLALFVGLAIYDYYRLPLRDQWRPAAIKVFEQSASSDVVVVVGPSTGIFRRYYQGSARICRIWPQLEQMAHEPERAITTFLRAIPLHEGRTWIVVREDPRFRRINFLERLQRYLRDHAIVPRTRIFPAVFPDVQGQIDLVDFQ